MGWGPFFVLYGRVNFHSQLIFFFFFNCIRLGIKGIGKIFAFKIYKLFGFKIGVVVSKPVAQIVSILQPAVLSGKQADELVARALYRNFFGGGH